jgi:cytidyltransferase-like protein
MSISVVSGGFDPIHSGHIAYIEAARKFGDKLIVCLNSNDWLTKKKGRFFLPFSERKTILEALSGVDLVVEFDDSDGSCINGLLNIKEEYPEDKITFCNGGDRTEHNIPELSIEGIHFEFQVGGDDKRNSSSKILNDWLAIKEERAWGDYSVLFNNGTVKVKELSISPNSGMSFQRHFERQEIWFVHSGSCKVFLQDKSQKNSTEKILKQGDLLSLPLMCWHQITNPFDEICKIIEIQYGSRVEEADIERQFFFPETP